MGRDFFSSMLNFPVDGSIRQSEKWPDARVFIGGNTRSLCGQYSLTPASNAVIKHGELGPAYGATTTSNAWGVDQPGTTWDGVLIVPAEVGTTGTNYNITGPTTTNTVRIMSTGIVLVASSAIRISTSEPVFSGEAVFAVLRTANYMISHKGLFYYASGTFGSWSVNTITRGNDKASYMVAIFPNWPNGQEESVLRLTSDPLGELLEQQKIWVPVNKPNFPSMSHRPLGTNAHLGR